MGTNYYRIKTEETSLSKVLTLADRFYYNREEIDDIREGTDEMLLVSTEVVHICKISYGWKTLFDHNNGKYYHPNRKELEEFLKEPGTIIQDEYGNTITPENLWDTVRRHDRATTMEPEVDTKCSWYDEIIFCNNTFGLKLTDPDSSFEVDGLKFSVFSEFC